MSNELVEPDVVPTDPEGGPEPEFTRAAPITSRFLFVDVAAQRAKQLRRGARPRLEESSDKPFKLERVAMREVEQGLIDYTTPPNKPAGAPEAGSNG
jgi:DNA-directed RNA polymerase omega subunit